MTEESLVGLLVKESADLDSCRCGSYCGDTSREIIELIEADTEEEIIARAVKCLPTYKCDRDAEPALYIVSKDLSEQLRAAFDAKIEEEQRIEKEREAAEAEKKRIAAAKARATRLREELIAIQSGAEEARLREKLMKAEQEAGLR